MLAEMSAQELAEWHIRASLANEIKSMTRGGVTYAEAYSLVFDKYRK